MKKCMQNYQCCGNYVKQNINIYFEDKPLINNSVVISVYYGEEALLLSSWKIVCKIINVVEIMLSKI